MSKPRLGILDGAGLAWVGANTVGYGVALAAWERWSQPLWPPFSHLLGGSLTLALYGATLGVGAGVAQALVLGRRSPGSLRWIAATSLGMTVSFVAASWVGLIVMRAFPPGSDKYLSNSSINISFGLLVGGGVGLARWMVLRRRSAASRRWILVSAICFMVGYGAAVGIFQLTLAIEQTLMGALFGGCIGAITAVFEWLWFGRRPDAWMDEAAIAVV
jgi:hypothetical protein